MGVRTKTQILIFSGYAGGGDAGDAGTDNLVYVQAFDPATANSLGAAQPLFAAPNGTGFVLESASVAPTGQIALAFSYGGAFAYDNGSSTQNSLYAAFLGTASDAGPALQRTVALVSGQITGQPHIVWSVATGAFVFSWEYYEAANLNWYVGTKNFAPNGSAVGGTDPVPTDESSSVVLNYSEGQEQGSVAAGPNLFGMAFMSSSQRRVWLTTLDLAGAQVGNATEVSVSTPNYPNWVTVAATAEGFVYIFDDGNSVSEVFVPTP